MFNNGNSFDNKILEIISAFYGIKDNFELLNVILTKMMEITDADAGTLYIHENNKLYFRIMKTISLNIFQNENINLPPINLDENNIDNVSAFVAIKNRIVTIDDVYKDSNFNFSGPKNYDKMTGYKTRSMLVMPLTLTIDKPNSVIGVIQLINATDKKTGKVKPFDDIYNPPFLPALANISANALANTLYTDEIKRMFSSFVSVMTAAVDERSAYTKNHTYNVAAYCDRFTKYLSAHFSAGHPYFFDTQRREQLVMAACLHDIGKIITPTEIMDKHDRLGKKLEVVKLKMQVKIAQIENSFLKNEISKSEYESAIKEIEEAVNLIEETNIKGYLSDSDKQRVEKLADIMYICDGENTPVLTEENMDALTVQQGNLTKKERAVMQEHVEITRRLLEKMKFNEYYKDVPEWASCHHEYVDGTGYPRGLAESEVTVEMCILTITDIFDALTAYDRPYKKAIPTHKALDILLSMANEGKLHKELVELFTESKSWETIINE